MPLAIMVWRHPRPQAVTGRCIGRTDVPVDRRRAKRLAHRIRQQARRDGQGLREVWSSDLQRCASVGRWLARWGWRHRIDVRLRELDFGRWDGQSWTDVGKTAVAAWCADFFDHAPGGGESLAHLMQRCADMLADWQGRPGVLVVGHAGWINALRHVLAHGAKQAVRAVDWPPACGYGARLRWSMPAHRTD